MVCIEKRIFKTSNLYRARRAHFCATSAFHAFLAVEFRALGRIGNRIIRACSDACKAFHA